MKDEAPSEGFDEDDVTLPALEAEDGLVAKRFLMHLEALGGATRREEGAAEEVQGDRNDNSPIVVDGESGRDKFDELKGCDRGLGVSSVSSAMRRVTSR